MNNSLSSANISDLLNLSTPEFVNLDQRRYHCVKCKKLLRNPQQISCGHRMCYDCVQSSLAAASVPREGGEQAKVSCPGSDDESTCDEIKENEVFPDFSAVREMRLLMVFCRYKKYGCSETMQWAKLPAHLDQCQYRFKLCQFCKLQLNVEQYDGTEDEVLAHEANLYYHLTLGLDYICRLQTENTAYRESLQQSQNDIQSLKDIINTSFSETRALNEKIQDLTEELKKSEERQSELLMKQSRKLQALEAQVKALEKTSQELALVRIRQNQQDTQISELKKIRKGDTVTLPEDMRQKFIMHDRTIGMHDVRLSELDIRCQCIETASYDGTLVWKITEYTKRKDEAKQGRHLSLFSQPFYTSRYGYKVCGRVYLNGDGVGRGTHLSFFFVVMRGEYDDIQEWPIKQKVTLTLIDQKTSSKHLSDSFRPDPQSASFQKPTSVMNVASGCPLFVAHTTLEGSDGIYLCNNTIFLKLAVDTTDLTNRF